MSKKGTGKLILGAGLGAGLALLFAPKKGSELREDLKCKINELVNKAKEVDTEEVKENLENKIDEIVDSSTRENNSALQQPNSQNTMSGEEHFIG